MLRTCLVLGFLAIIAWTPVSAAAPSNDACAGAAAIPGAGPFPYLTAVYDVADATSAGDPSSPTCQTNVSHGIWFRFAPGVSTEYSFSLCADAPTGTTLEDTVLAVYASADGTCAGALSPLAGGCDDDGCPLNSLQSVVTDLRLEAGRVYFVMVYEYGTAAPPNGKSAVQLRVAQAPPPPPPPANDTCAGAETIPGAGPFPALSTVTADVTGAGSSGDAPAPTCQPNGTRSVWYRFTPAAAGGCEISTCSDVTGTTLDDSIVSVYRSSDGTCAGAMSQVAGGCDDNTCVSAANQAEIPALSLDAGTTYYIVVQKFGASRPPIGRTAVQVRIAPTGPP